MSNLDSGECITHLSSYRRERWGNIIEPASAETYGVRVFVCLPTFIFYGYNFEYLEGHFKKEWHATVASVFGVIA